MQIKYVLQICCLLSLYAMKTNIKSLVQDLSGGQVLLITLRAVRSLLVLHLVVQNYVHPCNCREENGHTTQDQTVLHALGVLRCVAGPEHPRGDKPSDIADTHDEGTADTLLHRRREVETRQRPYHGHGRIRTDAVGVHTDFHFSSVFESIAARHCRADSSLSYHVGEALDLFNL